LSGKLDYSQIRVRLVTDEGREKGSSECAPNGYYFIPIYDSGSYFAVAEGPDGWHFEPSRVAIMPNRDADEDVDFTLTGFRVAGHVASSCNGPVSGVEFSLEADGQSRAVQSGADGVFAFAAVQPGSYILRAVRAGWAIGTPFRQLTVGWGGGALADAFEVLGYDVQGRVTSGDGPAPHISVILYAPAGAAAAAASCARPPADTPARGGEEAVCMGTTGADGGFVIAGVPCGAYTVAPQPARGRAAFDVVPPAARVVVAGPASAPAFRVERFAAIGSVVDHAGSPMAGVAVAVNGAARAMTDASGEYRLEALEPGTYRLTAVLAHVHFEPVSATVAAGAAALPTIAAARYDVCGSFERCTGSACTVTATTAGAKNPVSVYATAAAASALSVLC
jgi:protocatechuate 3,4-dioxygenase beta subunit